MTNEDDDTSGEGCPVLNTDPFVLCDGCDCWKATAQAEREARRRLVTTGAELATLDHDEVLEGYAAGLHGDGEPGDNRSKSYWHGWRNGDTDRTGVVHPESIALIKDMRRAGML